MFRKSLFMAVISLGIAMMQIGCGSDDGNGVQPPPVPPTRLVAAVHQDPTLDNALTSQVWDSILAAEIPIGSEIAYNAGLPKVDGKKVQMKALIADDSLLYIWARWDDNTESNLYGRLHATWVNDRTEWEKDTTFFNEDRFYFMFDKGGTSGADCASFCHSTTDTSTAGRRFYGAAGDDADVWHWKANRTGLARYAEDMHVTDTLVFQDPQERPYDSLYLGNFDSFLLRPEKMHQTGAAYTGPGLLEGEWIDYSASEEWVTFPVGQPPVGKYLPGYYLYNDTRNRGSRWDVRAASEQATGKWTIVFRRALTTADPEDIDFNFLSPDSIAFTIGIGDNSGVQHYGRRPFYLVFP